MIASRAFLESNGMQPDYNPSFKLDIPKEKEWMYYEDDIHKDRVSLSDPQNIFVKKSIEKKFHHSITCFDYDYIGVAVSREVPIVPKEQTRGLALGEVQVRDKVDSEYIIGLILPFSQEQLLDPTNILIVDKISEICNQNAFPLDIYNYEGELIKSKNTGKTK